MSVERADETEVVIVGAGPVGLELAVALKTAGVPYLQVEAGQIGSTIGWWAPGTRFFSSPERIAIAGVPLVTDDQGKATREQYLTYLRGVAEQFDLAIRRYERVVEIGRDDDGGFVLHTRPSRHGVGGPAEAAREDAPVAAAAAPAGPEARVIRAPRVVLAIGNMHRPRRIDVPGESLPHVSHYFAEPHRYAGRRVLIVGGKNSAVEAALRCYRVGARVAISYRGAAFDTRRVKYWLRPEIEWLIDKGRIGWHPGTVPIEITPSTVRLAGADGRAMPDAEVDAEEVLLMTGYVQDQRLFDDLALDRTGDERVPRFERATMTSTQPGVHLLGTAIGGSQRRTRVFIETAHVHVDRILRSITGHGVTWGCDEEYAKLEES